MEDLAGTRRRQMARAGAWLFAAGGIVTALGLLLPHQPEVDEAGLAALTAVCLAVAAILWLGRARLTEAAFHGAAATGTAFVTASLYCNGERLGGAAGNDEMYYLWIVLYVAYFLGRRAVCAHVALIAVVYGWGVAVVAPSDVAFSRWVSTVGLVVGAALVVRGLSERVDRLVFALHATARTDPLTDLPNRRAFEEAFAHAAARADRDGTGLAVLLGDLDAFKDVNDSAGHAAGDALLVQVGEILRATARAGDTVARFGGDEFAVLLPAAGAAEAERVGGRARAALDVGFSFGVAERAPDGPALDALLQAADDRLYADKRRA